MADPVGRVCIAMDPGDAFLESNPTWTRIDDIVRVNQIEISTGRQTEFDQTGTGTATVSLHDPLGYFDPSNGASPYQGNLDGKQIVIQMWDPIAETWNMRFRGLVDEYLYDVSGNTKAGLSINTNVQIQCVDLFEYLAGFEFIPGVHGDPAPAGSEGTVFYEDGDIQVRIVHILTDAGLNTDFYVVFSGNVNVIETKYDPGDSCLIALRDAADAEQKSLANCYVDRFGRFVFHGRFAKLDPEGVIAAGPVSTDTWDFNWWFVGDAAAIAAEPSEAWVQVRPSFQSRRARSRVVNSALAFPRWNDDQPLDEADIPTLVVQDAGSIASYGVHSWSAKDLIVQEHKSNGNDALDECLLSATFVVENNKQIQDRVEALTVKAIPVDHAQAADTWAFLNRSDISDRVTVKVYTAGGGGVFGDFFIEGSQTTITPASPIEDGGVDMVVMTLNVSPAPGVNVY